MAVNLERVWIASYGARLAGLLYRPLKVARGTCVVLAHGLTASKESLDVLASYLCARGYPGLSFDFRGHKLGASEGDLHGAEELLEDLAVSTKLALERFESESALLVGHSMGGLISLVAAARMKEAAGAAAIATGTRPSAGFRQPVGIAMLSQRADYITGIAPMALLEELDQLASALTLAKPALLVAASADVVVRPSTVRDLALQIGPRAECIEIAASHLDAADRARGHVANWIDRTFV